MKQSYARRRIAANNNPSEGPNSPAAAVRDMREAGAAFLLAHDGERRAWQYKYVVKPDGNAARCGAVFAKAQSDPAFFSRFKVTIFAAIVRDAWGLPEGGR